MPEPGPFERHVREAIALNRQRRPGYVRAGGARAALLSRLLVGLERALLPVARRLDRRASSDGCTEALGAVLSPMSATPEADNEVRGVGRGAPIFPRLTVILARPLANADRALRQGDAPEATRRLDRIVRTLRETSAASGLHLAMALHIAESARLGASRADGPCAGVLTRFVRLHLLGLPLALMLDALAARLHARGVGILVNDLPPIPAP